MITPFGIVWVVAMSIGFGIAGWFCIFRTEALVRYGRRNYEKSRFIRAYPFSNIVQKDWYPKYLRCAGVFLWVWALLVDCLVLFRRFH